jgi:hypothetical protein
VQGKTAQRFRTVITLGVLSFNKYQPTDQKVGVRNDQTAAMPSADKAWEFSP